MKKFFVFLIFIIYYSLSQSPHAIVTYKYSFNGNEMADMPKVQLSIAGGIAIIVQLIDEDLRRADEKSYLDYSGRRAIQTVLFKNGKRCTVITPFDEYPKPELTDEYETILGYRCRKAKVVIRSNNIEIWFNEDSGLKGTPLLNQGAELGLVLKIVRNGNYVVEAEKIDVNTDVKIEAIADLGEIVDMPTYREKITGLNYTTVQIFSQDRLAFNKYIYQELPDETNIIYYYQKGTLILKKVKLPDSPWGKTIVAELSSYSLGDAYDRTGSLFIIPDDKNITFLDAIKDSLQVLPPMKARNGKSYYGLIVNEDYTPLLELMRFITPFGINKYNDQVKVNGIRWEDSVIYRQDITELAGVLKGEVWFGAFVGNYDKNGHLVNLKLRYFPDDPDAKDVPEKKTWIQPVINTVNVLEVSGQENGTMFDKDTLSAYIDVPEGLKKLTLRYISTGHGGWDGGDEFNQKLNEIFVDGKCVYAYVPWRTDCGMYRKFNPASGNFPNGMSSSDFSRSGWCPGSVSIPVDIPLTGVTAGKHKIGVYIPIGKPEGTSVSSWNVSAVMIGEY
jgi:peptide-N-glycosidase F-like protein